jgi:phosphopantothenoylcysteine synthetase/decarboxylase
MGPPWIVLAAGGALEASFLPYRVFTLRAALEARITVALSGGARELTSEVALEALTGAPVYRDVAQLDDARLPLHASWSSADLLVLSPATARIVAECALGIVRCAPTRLFSFTPKERIVVAPALHPSMDRRIYEPHVRRLAELGCTVLGGDDLFVAWDDVVRHVRDRLALRARPMIDKPFLLTDRDA